MPTLKIAASDFNLSSSYTCITTNQYVYRGDNLIQSIEPASTYTTDATRGTKVVHFDLAELNGAKIISAKMYATLGSPLNGAATSTINGTSVGTADTVSVDVPIADGATSVDVECIFECNAVWHSHGEGSGAEYEYYTNEQGELSVSTEAWRYAHQSSLSYTDVYLLIEYEGSSGYIYHAEGGALVPYQLYRAENGVLVPYQLQRAVDDVLVPYG